MPAIVRPVGDERDALLTFLAHERHVLVIAAYGLTDEQAWSTPTASDLSIAFLIEHMTSTERTWASMVLGGAAAAAEPSEPPTTLAAIVAAYEDGDRGHRRGDRRRRRLRPAVKVADGTRWAPPDTEWSVRWVLLHLIHETARHAGHADIIRETIDGATALPLMAAVEEWPPRRTITPWTPPA